MVIRSIIRKNLMKLCCDFSPRLARGFSFLCSCKILLASKGKIFYPLRFIFIFPIKKENQERRREKEKQGKMMFSPKRRKRGENKLSNVKMKRKKTSFTMKVKKVFVFLCLFLSHYLKRKR